jgi:hypothetical protein
MTHDDDKHKGYKILGESGLVQDEDGEIFPNPDAGKHKVDIKWEPIERQPSLNKIILDATPTTLGGARERFIESLKDFNNYAPLHLQKDIARAIELVTNNDITNNPEWLDRWLEAVELVDLTPGYNIHCEPPWGFNDRAFQSSLQRKNRCCKALREHIIKEKSGKKGGLLAFFKKFS